MAITSLVQPIPGPKSETLDMDAIHVYLLVKVASEGWPLFLVLFRLSTQKPIKSLDPSQENMTSHITENLVHKAEPGHYIVDRDRQ